MKVVIIGGVAGGATAAARIRRLDEQAEIIVFERSGYISYANCGLPYYIGDTITDGVAGGATAAARIRRLDEQAEIIVFERSGYISYANCGLPYYIGDTITEPKALTLQTPESFFSRFQITMKVRHEVTAIHAERNVVSVKNLETGAEFEESYDKLLLSPGAKPSLPPVLRRATINFCSPLGQNHLFPQFRELTSTVFLRFAPWKILSVLKTILIKRIPALSYWQEAVSSALNLQKISVTSVWRLPLFSARNSL